MVGCIGGGLAAEGCSEVVGMMGWEERSGLAGTNLAGTDLAGIDSAIRLKV